MKTLQKFAAAAFACALLALPSLAADPTPTASPSAVRYTCPMHPEVVKDAPGNCPKCGMKLVEKKDPAPTLAK